MVFRKRAIQPEDKEARREAILAAARRLLEEGAGEPAAVSKVAREAGLAKGTLYLYFKSSEEIYLALLEEEYAAWMNEIAGALEPSPESLPAPEASSGQSEQERETRERVLNALVDFPARRPLFLRLATLHYSMMNSIDVDVLREWKARLALRLADLGARLDERLGLPAGDGPRLLRNTHALITGLHQMAVPPNRLREVLDEPGFREHRFDFEHELHDALRALWLGWPARAAAVLSPGRKQ